MSVQGAVAPLAGAREALAAHRWSEAFDLLSKADRAGGLQAEDLEGLSQAAWFTAHPDESLDARERAVRAHLDAGDRTRATVLSFDISREYAWQGRYSLAAAWIGRGERLLRDQPEGVAHGYHALAQSGVARSAGDVDRAIELAASAADIGARHGDVDLQAWALIGQGTLLIATGRLDEGFPLMEEATIAAVNGDLSPYLSGVVYCTMIAVYRNTTDYRRASEWTEAANRWCERQAISGFPGVCRIHRAEIEGLQGGFARVEQELIQATNELSGYHATGPLGDGFYALGEIRMRMGDLDGAEEALRQAHAMGRSPYPALALIRLAQGNVRAAVAAIDGAVAETTWDRWALARLLPVQVEVAIAAGNLDTARLAANELGRLSETLGSPTLRASRHECRGRLLAVEGEPDDAVRELRTAISEWQQIGAPYDVARTRVVLSTVLRQVERDDQADLELRTAVDEFERLGAARDAAVTADALRAAEARRAGPTATHKTFVFTDIVGSTTLAGAMGDQVWEGVLRWHDGMMRALFEAHDGEVVSSAGDGFFVVFDTASQAVDCAIAVQRALAEHRRMNGFAPSIRIGLHAAEANRRGTDYSGMGVHVAARIGALAEGDQILASASTLEGPSSHAVSEPRTVSLRGVPDPVDVVSIAWD